VTETPSGTAGTTVLPPMATLDEAYCPVCDRSYGVSGDACPHDLGTCESGSCGSCGGLNQPCCVMGSTVNCFDLPDGWPVKPANEL